MAVAAEKQILQLLPLLRNKVMPSPSEQVVQVGLQVTCPRVKIRKEFLQLMMETLELMVGTQFLLIPQLKAAQEELVVFRKHLYIIIPNLSVVQLGQTHHSVKVEERLNPRMAVMLVVIAPVVVVVHPQMRGAYLHILVGVAQTVL